MQYDVLRPLGLGAFSEVLLARALGTAGFEKHVALKVLHAEHGEEYRFVELLQDEARLLALVRHRAIVQVDNLVHYQGRWAVVMEYVPGQNLRELLRAHGPLPPGPVWEIGAELASALHTAHAATGLDGRRLNLIHRDLKPANVRLTPAGDVKLLDFGVASASVRSRSSASTVQRFGTIGFTAPEQIDGAAVAASDIYSLGATLKLLLTGGLDTPPPELELLESMMGAVPSERPRPQELETRFLELARAQDGLSLRQWASTVIQPLETEGAGEATAATGLAAATGEGTSNLRPPSDAFVGRADTLAELRVALRESRLVTLRGPGGAGKTRTAAEFGWGERRRFAGGAWLCDLTEARDGVDLAQLVSMELGLPRASALEHALAQRGQLLLILDNMEQLPPNAVTQLTSWLAAAPGLQIVATSRRPLGLDEERLVELGPLSLDATDGNRSPAAALLADRIVDARPDLENALDETQLQTVVELVDGLPLAIELAASRARTLELGVLTERLSEQLRTLRTRDRSAHERHRTLSATLQWSWDLLEPAQRSLLAQLSVFVGDFDLPLMEQVVELGEVDPEFVFEELLDQSMVQPVLSSPGRFRLLVAVRDFSSQRLDAAERESTMARLCAALLRFLPLERTMMAAGLRWIRQNEGHAFAAFHWARENGRELEVSILHRHLDRHLKMGARVAQAQSVIQQAIAACPTPKVRRRIRANTMAIQDPTEFKALALEAQAAGEPETELVARCYQAARLRRQGDSPQAFEVASAAYRRSLNYDLPSAEALAALESAFALMVQSRWSQAVEWLAHAESAYERLPSDVMLATVWHRRAYLLMITDAHQEAEALLKRCVPVFQEAGRIPSLLDVRFDLAKLDANFGRLEDARRTLLEGVDQTVRIGEPAQLSRFLRTLGAIEGQLGNLSAARWRLRQSIRTMENNRGAHMVRFHAQITWDVHNARLGIGDAVAQAEQLKPGPNVIPRYGFWRVSALARAGDLDAAEAQLRSYREAFPEPTLLLELTLSAVEADWEELSGRPERARTLREDADERAAQAGIVAKHGIRYTLQPLAKRAKGRRALEFYPLPARKSAARESASGSQ